jgi:DNA-binding NarL/FixJ family response regulator
MSARRPSSQHECLLGTLVSRILIADDHEVVRAGLRSILEAHDGWEIVAEAENGRDAISKALASKPDVQLSITHCR